MDNPEPCVNLDADITLDVWEKKNGKVKSVIYRGKGDSVDINNSKNITADNSSEDTSDNITGIHGFYHKNIFEAVYCTNLLMRSADVLVTKPSELAFYPVPKLFIKRVGGHEQWGAVHSAEIGDGTLECRDIPHTLQMIKLFMEDDTYIIDMCKNIKKNKQMGIYNGAYEAVKLAVNMKKSDI